MPNTKAAAALVCAVTLTATVGNLALGAGPASAQRALTSFITPTPISACGAITAPGSYALTANLGPVAGTCLVLSAPNVTIDLAGHTVTGTKLATSGGVEILAGAVDATVESTRPGGAIVAFHAGVQDYANGAAIQGPFLSLSGNAGAGVFLYRVSASRVQGVVLSGNGYFGANVELSRGVTVAADHIGFNGDYGIWVQSSSGAQVVQNVLTSNAQAGIYFGCSYTSNLQDVGCRPSDGSMVEGNTLHNNGPFGIAIADQSLDNKINANKASGDSQAGLWDENPGCAGVSAPPNSWQQNGGTRNQTVSATCIS